MSILFAATEPEAFATDVGTWTSQVTGSTSASAGAYDTNFSRCATILDAGSTTYPAIDLGGALDIWFHYRIGGQPFDNASLKFLTIVDSTLQGILRLETNTSTEVFMSYWDGATWVEGTKFSSLDALGATIDLHCKIDGVAGEFSWWFNGTEMQTITGDTDHFASSISYIQLQTWQNFIKVRGSEVIIADEVTVGMRVATLDPTGNGTNTAWTGSYTDIDEISVSDADFITSSTANEVETFTLSDLSLLAASMIPVCVVNSFRGSIGATGPQNLQTVVRSGGTDYPSSSLSGLTSSFSGGHQIILADNPATASPWTPSEIDALEAGVKSIT